MSTRRLGSPHTGRALKIHEHRAFRLDHTDVATSRAHHPRELRFWHCDLLFGHFHSRRAGAFGDVQLPQRPLHLCCHRVDLIELLPLVVALLFQGQQLFIDDQIPGKGRTLMSRQTEQERGS